MALALADSIAEVGWDLDDQAARYVAWWRTGAYSVNRRVFDIGVTTCAALCRGSGYVVKSLEAALWAFDGAADFVRRCCVP